MDLGTIVSTVLDTTGRTDKETYIRSQLNGILRYIDSQFDFHQDLVETIETVAKTTLLNLAIPVNLRKVSYLRPLPHNKLLDEVVPSRVINPTLKQELTNCYYPSGNNFVIRLRTGYETTQLAFGRFEYPTMPVADADSNWLMNEFDNLITDMLTAKVFRVTGDINSARGLEEGANGIGDSIIRLRQYGSLSIPVMGA